MVALRKSFGRCSTVRDLDECVVLVDADVFSSAYSEMLWTIQGNHLFLYNANIYGPIGLYVVAALN